MYRTLLATLLALVAFVQAIESVSAGNQLDEFVEFYNSVFGPNGAPLEPEEARKAIERIANRANMYENYEFYDTFLVTGLKNAELRAEECDFENFPNLSNWGSVDIRSFTMEQPALQPYMNSLRAKMVECFRRNMDAAVKHYSSMVEADKTGAYAYLKESLASMPLDFFTTQNFIETKDDRISKVLARVVNKKYGPTSLKMIESKLTTSFAKRFQDSVVEFCKEVVRVQLVPRSVQSIAYRQDTVGMLGQEVVDWAKVQHLCEQIKRNPSTASEIVHSVKA